MFCKTRFKFSSIDLLGSSSKVQYFNASQIKIGKYTAYIGLTACNLNEISQSIPWKATQEGCHMPCRLYSKM